MGQKLLKNSHSCQEKSLPDLPHTYPLQRLHIISLERSSRHMFAISVLQTKDQKCSSCLQFFGITHNIGRRRENFTTPTGEASTLSSAFISTRQSSRWLGHRSSGRATILWMPSASFATIAPLGGRFKWRRMSTCLVWYASALARWSLMRYCPTTMTLQ